VVAHEHEVFVGVKLLVGASGDVAHGNEDAAVDLGSGELPGFANVYEAGLALFEQGGGFGGGKFEIEHGDSLTGCGVWGVGFVYWGVKKDRE